MNEIIRYIAVIPDNTKSTVFENKSAKAIVGKEINDSTNKYFAIDTAGKELFSFSSNEYKDFGSFNNGYLPVQKENDEVVLLDKAGKRFSSIGKWKGHLPS